jgi:putative membrane protein insertion efficiency factor
MCQSPTAHSAEPGGAEPDSAELNSVEPNNAAPSWAARGLIGLIYVYRWTLSPFLGGRCRFMPSCSEYGLIALRKHGAWKGGWMTLGRILRCQPFCRGGVDYP